MLLRPLAPLVLVACVSAEAEPDVPVAVEPEPPVAEVAETPPTPEEEAPVAPVVHDHLLPYDAERVQLTAAYLRAHRTAPVPEDDTAAVVLDPKVVVLHWTAGPTAEGAWNTFAPTRLRGRKDIADAGAVNVSAHYLVDRDGRIARLLPDDRVGRHVIGLNHVALGIENVGGGEQWPLTDAQVEANAALVRHLAGQHGLTHLIGHHEYRGLEGTELFEEQDPSYRTVKPDPGVDFMAAVRARVADLGLEGVPE